MNNTPVAIWHEEETAKMSAQAFVQRILRAARKHGVYLRDPKHVELQRATLEDLGQDR